jgi:hypothetical protein
MTLSLAKFMSRLLRLPCRPARAWLGVRLDSEAEQAYASAMKRRDTDLFAHVATNIRESKRLRRQTQEHLAVLERTAKERPEAVPDPRPPSSNDQKPGRLS